jgi:hypothetical protein
MINTEMCDRQAVVTQPYINPQCELEKVNGLLSGNDIKTGITYLRPKVSWLAQVS